MATTTISSKFQLVIPKEIREKAGIKAGEHFEVIAYEGRIELIPIGPVNKLKGFLKGISTSIEREGDRL